MLIEERHRRIVEWINRSGQASTRDMSQVLGVSEITVWRDLVTLEEKRLIKRVRGGAVNTENGFSSSLEPQFQMKMDQYGREKTAIAQLAAQEYVVNNDIIILEGGTTVANMVPFLQVPQLTILTHALPILTLIAPLVPEYTILSSGGVLRDVSHTFVGAQAEAFFAQHRAKTLFIGASGLTLEDSITDPNPLEVQVKRAMQKNAEKTILLLDSSKFGKRALLPIIPLQEIDVLITDHRAPEGVLDTLRADGIDIRIACCED